MAPGEADRSLLLDIKGHAREEADGIDLSRTVRWFTTLYPVRLDPGPGDLGDAASLGRAVKLIKEQLRAVPEKGLGYELLRYFDPEGRKRLAGLRLPELSFNYLGRFPASGSEPQDWAERLRGNPATPPLNRRGSAAPSIRPRHSRMRSS